MTDLLQVGDGSDWVKKGIEYWVSDSGVCLLEGWARAGLSEGKIARKMGVKVEELRRLRVENEVVERALVKGKEVVDLEVEGALLKKALTGDVRACSYWLKNRMGGVWKDRGSAVNSEELIVNSESVEAEIEGLLDGAVEGRELE